VQYDYAQNGVELKEHTRILVETMVQMNDNIVGLDAAILITNNLEASGHVDAFNDPLIDNKDSKEDIEPMF
jgi:glycyl-tRNA synthetase